MRPAIFLDRDGVIIENKFNYIQSWSDVDIFPQALEGLKLIASSEYKIFIVTNQSAIGRGIILHSTAEEINQRLIQEIEKAGGRIDKTFICPHDPRDFCSCRKPRPGLIHQAAQLYEIDLSSSIMIGDAITDIMAGINAGIKTNIIVKTGRGAEQMKRDLLIEEGDMLAFQICEDLRSALFKVWQLRGKSYLGLFQKHLQVQYPKK